MTLTPEETLVVRLARKKLRMPEVLASYKACVEVSRKYQEKLALSRVPTAERLKDKWT